MGKIVLDLRLLEVSMELSTLGKQLELIENQIKQSQEGAKIYLEENLQKLSSNDEAEWEAEWDLLRQEYDYQVDFVLPRVLRNPFLVSIFAVYESAITEIAKLIQEKQGGKIALDDLKGDLLERSRKYYSHVLQFELSKSNVSWERLKLLSKIRNTIAHRNGRIDMIPEGTRKKILQSRGVRNTHGFVVVDDAFLRETFNLVKDELEDLVARYKEWDATDSD